MRIAICQMRSTGDVARNLELGERLLREAGDGGAELAALPEFVDYLGPSSGRAVVAAPVPGALTERFASVARSG
jgi:predicted amidohydrolase